MQNDGTTIFLPLKQSSPLAILTKHLPPCYVTDMFNKEKILILKSFKEDMLYENGHNVLKGVKINTVPACLGWVSQFFHFNICKHGFCNQVQ